MKHKKIIFIVLAIIIVSVLAFGSYFILTREDKNTTLTLLEKQWIESNKNKVIDLSVINNIPVLNYNGEGIFFDFLSSLETDTKLEFNKLSYNSNEDIKSEYAIQKVEQVNDNDILLYEDPYVILSDQHHKYYNLKDLKPMTIGVLQSDIDKVSYYLTEANQLEFKTYEDVDTLLEASKEVKGEDGRVGHAKEVDAIILPQTFYLKEIIDHYHILYRLSGLTQKYVLHLGKTEKLNTILKKYYQKWENDFYKESYSKHLANNYFTFSDIDEKQKANFKSKRYVYGFVENGPYDHYEEEQLSGLNHTFMQEWSNTSGAEISFKKYDNMESLLSDFNANKLDFFFGMNANQDYKMDTYQTVSLYEEEGVLVSSNKNPVSIQTLYGLSDQTISVIKNTKLEKLLTDKKIKIKVYPNMEKMLKSHKEDEILALDLYSYEYYSKKELKEYKIDYQFQISASYPFVIRDISENAIFKNFLNFFISFADSNLMRQLSYQELFTIKVKSQLWKWILIPLLTGIIVIFAIFGVIKFLTSKPKKKKGLSKEEKLKYIDMLTSLKNRNYLNENIEKWDESEVYPQTIIILDLNNISYINDNYGHQEGDLVIQEAADILIRNQYPNSEIIRTNGNEFLIYLVGYDEKQIVSYVRKLSKEMKELTHGFGAALGYSMIQDAIKTIDDAVNEATIDMKNNKEEDHH